MLAQGRSRARGRLVRALADARARRRGAVPARRRCAHAAVADGRPTARHGVGSPAPPGVLAMVLWDDITDDGTSTLVGGALAFDTFAQFVTITICAAVVLVALITDDYLRARGPRRSRGLRPLPRGGDRRRRDGRGQRPDRAVPRPRDALAGALRARRQLPPQRGSARRAASSTSCSAASRRRSSSTASPSSTAPSARRTSARWSAVPAAPCPVERNDALVLAGIALLLVGLGFKVAAVPFHVWTPDVYQGAPTPVTGVHGVGRQGRRVRRPAAGVRGRAAVLPRRLAPGRLGARRAVARRRLVPRRRADRRQADARLLVDQPRRVHPRRRRGGGAPRRGGRQPASACRASLVYLFAYAVLVVGTFAVVTLVARAGDGDTTLDAFRGLGRQRPLLALALTVFLVAQAGVPFTIGFIAKFGVIQAGVDEHSYALAIIAMVASVVAAFLYLRIMVSAWMADPPPRARRPSRCGSPFAPGWRSPSPRCSRSSSASSPVAPRRRRRRPVRRRFALLGGGGPWIDRGRVRPCPVVAPRSTTARRRDLRRMKAFATGAARARRRRLPRRPGQRGHGAGVDRLRAGRRRGGDGRRARRLVRGHRAVPPPARAADPAHGDHPPPQGPDRAQPRRVRAGQLPDPRGARRAPGGRPRRASGSALARRARPRRASRRRVADGMRRTIEVLDDRDVVRRHRQTVVEPAAHDRGGAARRKAIDVSVEGGHHQRLLDAVLNGLATFLDENRARPAGGSTGVAVVGARADRRPHLREDLQGRAALPRRRRADPDHEVRHGDRGAIRGSPSACAPTRS